MSREYRTVDEARDEVRRALVRSRVNMAIRLALILWLTGVLAALAVVMLATNWMTEPLANVVNAAIVAGLGVMGIALVWYTTQRGVEFQRQTVMHLQKARVDLWRATVRDELTHLYNRRHFYDRLEEELALAELLERPLALLLGDIKGLKEVNDTHGHRAGDLVLQHVAEILKRATRLTDVVARLGGDEFAVLLPGTGEEGAQVVLRRLARDIAARPVQLEGNDPLPVDMALGLAVFPEDGRTIEELFRHANDEKRRAKTKAPAEDGRSRAAKAGTRQRTM